MFQCLSGNCKNDKFPLLRALNQALIRNTRGETRSEDTGDCRARDYVTKRPIKKMKTRKPWSPPTTTSSSSIPNLHQNLQPSNTGKIKTDLISTVSSSTSSLFSTCFSSLVCFQELHHQAMFASNLMNPTLTQQTAASSICAPMVNLTPCHAGREHCTTVQS